MNIRMRVLKLGTVCTDIATELEGTLTHWILGMDQHVQYVFQPKGLDEEGRPVNKILLGQVRLKVNPEDYEEVEVPFEILGTNVTDKASGFTGMAVEFIRHINGCFHVAIQPAGVVKKKNTPFERMDFDLRQCTGQKIVALSERELKKSKEDRPSPTGDTFSDQMPSSIRAGSRPF